MSDDRQFGEGQDNYLQGIRSAAEAAKQAGFRRRFSWHSGWRSNGQRGRSYSASRYGDWQSGVRDRRRNGCWRAVGRRTLSGVVSPPHAL